MGGDPEARSVPRSIFRLSEVREQECCDDLPQSVRRTRNLGGAGPKFFHLVRRFGFRFRLLHGGGSPGQNPVHRNGLASLRRAVQLERRRADHAELGSGNNVAALQAITFFFQHGPMAKAIVGSERGQFLGRRQLDDKGGSSFPAE